MNVFRTTILLVIFITLLSVNCIGQEKRYQISIDELILKMESDSNLIILDVRRENELSGPLGHIDNIIHIPLSSLEARISELTVHKNSYIAVICKMGSRSAYGTKILRENGFNAYNVKGGMIEYRNRIEVKVK
jgi:rhodanese-related sulfurtransferase